VPVKVALAGYGSRGDVEPLAAVGRELLRRGHHVAMAAPPDQLGLVASAGLTAVEYGPGTQALRGQEFAPDTSPNPINTMVKIAQHFTQAMTDFGTTLTEQADGADLLLTNASEEGLATSVAECYGIPLATLHFFPGARPRGLIGDIAKDAENALRRQLGLPEATGRSAELEIQAYDELWFPGLAAKWGEQGRRRPFVGTLTLELPTDVDAEVLSWIAQGTPPIYFGFGSNVQIPYPDETIGVISAACAHLGERALICSGSSDFSWVTHADHVKIVTSVNHGAVFPACRAVVHQGGAGTTAAGIRAGMPSLILWFSSEDQPTWAQAITRLKVGCGRQFSASTLATLVADLRSVLAPECALRAQELAPQMTKPAESVATAVDLLEETARLGRAG
jgi:UDP:flavonoid glycosyltransferase YjiC (YdhE family)